MPNLPTRMTLAAVCAAVLASVAPSAPAWAQASNMAFGRQSGNSDQPVEVEADNLAVSQNDGTAEFSGNVMITQGDLKLSAPRVLVRYTEDQSAIRSLEATGGVTILSGKDVAESERADYDVPSDEIVLSGSVMIVQGATTLTSDRVTLDVETGQARMEGRVRTLLAPGRN